MAFDKFNISSISEALKIKMINMNIWNPKCPVSFDDLKFLTISHYDFYNNIKDGEIIIHTKMAENALKIFQELLTLKFPIDKMHTIDFYKGNDEASMADNNSSSFNFRMVSATGVISMHSYGLAIDINPVQNPYVTFNDEKATAIISPKASIHYMNRTNQRKGMVEPIISIFRKYGFDEWGGNWNSCIDYHHFQIKREKIKTL